MERFTVLGLGMVRTRKGIKVDVELLDLSETGCRVKTKAHTFKEGEDVSLRIEQLGPFDAKVKWALDRHAGLEFDADLYQPIFDHLREKLLP